MEKKILKRIEDLKAENKSLTNPTLVLINWTIISELKKLLK